MSYLPLFLPQNPVAVISRTDLAEIKKRSLLQCLGLLSRWTRQNSFLHCKSIQQLWKLGGKHFATAKLLVQWLNQKPGKHISPGRSDKNLYSDFWWKKKNHPELIFQAVFLVPNWKLPALQRVWISLTKGSNMQTRVWEILGKQSIAQDFCVSDLQWCLWQGSSTLFSC